MYKWLFVVISLGISSIQGFALSEIVISAHKGIYCLSSNGVLRWSFPYQDNKISGAAIGNIDNVGYPEVLIGAEDRFYCLEYDGTLKWSYPISTECCSPVIANIDNAGNPEILIADSSFTLYCFNNDGTVKWTYGMSGSGWFTASAITVANVDGIGTPEILVSTNSHVYCIDNNGILDWSYALSGALFSAVGVAVADIDLNGNPEILIGSDSYIYCLEWNGIERWIYTGKSEISQPAIADINNDGKIEIVVHQLSATTAPREIIALQENATSTGLDTVWIAQCTDKSGGSAAVPVICDIDGDGDKDVMWIGCTGGAGTTMVGLLYIFNGIDGKHPDNSGAPCYTNSNFASGTLYERGVAVADIDDDGHVEIVGIKCGGGTSARAGVSVLECNTWANGRDLFTSHLYHITEINDNLTIPTTEPNNWGSHNTWLTQLTTGGSGFGSPTIKWTYTNPAMDWITNSITIAPIYNPAGIEENNFTPKPSDLKVLHKNGRRVIVFTLSKSEEVCFHIFDIVGRKKETLNIGTMSAGTHEIPLELNNIKSGVYFIKAHLGNRVLNYKTIIL